MTKRESSAAEIAAWFGERLPAEWAEPAPQVTVDREEITVVLTIAAPETPDATQDERADEDTAAARAEAVAGRVARFRADTRDAPHRDRPRGGAPVPQEGGVGRPLRRSARDLHAPRGAGDDPPAPAGAPGARHVGGGRRRAVARARPGLVRPARGRQHRGVADRSCGRRWPRWRRCGTPGRVRPRACLQCPRLLRGARRGTPRRWRRTHSQTRAERPPPPCGPPHRTPRR